MVHIISEFDLDKKGFTQHNVDFLNVYLGVDNSLFLDYNKIILGSSPLYKLMQKDLNIFMKNMFEYLAKGNDKYLEELLLGLHETNATHLGMSKYKPKGNSVGDELKKEILNNLKFLKKIFLKGNLEIDCLYFGIEKIGPDRISDIVTSIIKSKLILFTQQQCFKHSIQTKPQGVSRIFDSNTVSWGAAIVELPIYDNKPVIFVPKDIVSSYAGISGTFDSFVRYGFNNFFKSSLDYKLEVRGKEGDIDSDLKRKEFDEHFKSLGLNKKNISQKILLETTNLDLVNVFAENRKLVSFLSDDELVDIVENKLKKAN